MSELDLLESLPAPRQPGPAEAAPPAGAAVRSMVRLPGLRVAQAHRLSWDDLRKLLVVYLLGLGGLAGVVLVLAGPLGRAAHGLPLTAWPVLSGVVLGVPGLRALAAWQRTRTEKGGRRRSPAGSPARRPGRDG